MPVLRSLYRALLPGPVRERIQARRRNAAFKSAFRRILLDPLSAMEDDALVSRLLFGWGNEGWSANGAYLRRIVQYLRDRPGAVVLECGSGLSTLVVGAVARQTGARLFSLEHHAEWRERVRQTLTRFGIAGVTVVLAPIEDYGAFEWYRPDAAARAQKYDMIICDGPPGDTRGGRYGLLPVMRQTLTDDCVVLLDDANRDAERDILDRWIAEYGGSAQVLGGDGGEKQYGEYRLKAMAARSAHGLGAST